MLFTTASKLSENLKNFRSSTKKIGFVPTMGALHSGHMSLITKAHQQTEVVVVSIFVNPTQFNNSSDLEKYPRNLEKDIDYINDNYPNTLIFAPAIEEMYTSGCQSESFDFGELEKVMEGAFRPGHFNGVGTIVKRLFEVVQPDIAFFGEKDFQQLAVVKKLVELTKLPVQIVGCETEREPNGLAKSSRNERLSETAREEAKVIFESLSKLKLAFNYKSPVELKVMFETELESNTKFELEYIQIADEETLQPVEEFEKEKKYRAFTAVIVEEVRLIDNIALN